MKIELTNIKPTYMSATEVATSDIYLQDSVVFEKGKKYLITANSGHGKTSILNFIYGNNINFNGQISYNTTFDGNVFNLRKTNISYIFQDLKLFPDLTVFENIQLKNTITNHKTVDEIDKFIEQVLLGHKRDNLINKLSLGQKQRVAIIRAICQPFDFLLLDEPFSHLDKNNIKIISNIINQEIKNNNASLIVTSLANEYFFDYDKVFNL